MPRKLYTKIKRKLILHSDSLLSEEPDLYKIMQDNPELLTDQISNYDIETQRKLNTAVFNAYFESCKLEWSVIYEFGLYAEKEFRKSRCELCNHQIDWVFRIVNYKNNEELKIGSRCIEEYELQGSKYTKEQREQINKNSKSKNLSTKREAELDYLTNGYVDYVRGKSKYINNLKYRPPIEIIRRFQMNLTDARKFILDYKKNADTDIELFRIVVERLKLIEIQIEEWIEQNKGNPLVLETTTYEWLQKQTNKDIKDRKKITYENGIITISLFSFVREDTFIKKLIPIIKNGIKDSTFRITSFECSMNRITISFPFFEQKIEATFDLQSTLYSFRHVIFDNANFNDFDMFQCLDRKIKRIDDIRSLSIIAQYFTPIKDISNYEVNYLQDGIDNLVFFIDRQRGTYRKFYLPDLCVKLLMKDLSPNSSESIHNELYQIIKREKSSPISKYIEYMQIASTRRQLM